MVNRLFELFNVKRRTLSKGRLGLEIRPDGLAVAYFHDNQLQCQFIAVSAAQRDDALRNWVQDQQLKGRKCRVVLPVGQYKSYLIEKPQVADDELPEAVRWRLSDMLEFDVEDAVVDVFEFPEDALRGRPPRVNAVVCRNTIVKTVVDVVTQAGLELETIDIADLALRNAASRVLGSESDQPQACLYLRKGRGLVVFTKGATLYLARQIDFSLDALNDPAQQDGVIQTLALEVQRSFDYFESELAQLPPQDLHLFGPSTNLPLVNMLGGRITAKVKPLDVQPLMLSEDDTTIECLLAVGAVLREDGV